MRARTFRDRSPATLLGVVALLVLTARPAAAECTGGLAPLRAAAPTAERILIGTVTGVAPGVATDDDGRSPQFTLRVTEVLRGPRVSTIDVRDLDPGCSGDKIAAAVGEVVVLAIDAHGSGRWGTYSTIAWVHSTGAIASANRTTREQAFAFASSAPETDTEATPGAVPSPLPLALLAVSGALGAVFFWRRSSLRRT
jgi:hypothetical protein